MSGVGEGSRELSIGTGADGESDVRVAAQDLGPGLTPESFARLFDAFYTTKPGGMGLGLSICRSIIEAHWGRMWATPSVSSGVTFQFALPRQGAP
jgi:signal transduction histidine kinase